MPKVAVITDTDSSLPLDMAAGFNILQVPISIHFGDELTGTDHTLKNAQLFEQIDKRGKLPTTAAPTPGVFEEYFRKVFQQEKPRTLVYFSISAEMSATIKSAQLAAQNMPEYDIRVIDSGTLSMAQGYMVLAAAEAAQASAEVEQVIQTAQEIKERTLLYGALSTLKYLSMSGRVSHVAAGMAGMLDIKPILSVQNGKLDMLEKIRTRTKSWQRMIELVKIKLAGRRMERACILHVNDESSALKFQRMLASELDCPSDLPLVDINPGLSVHTGAGLVGTCLVIGK